MMEETKELTDREKHLQQSLEILQNNDFNSGEFIDAVKKINSLEENKELPWEVQRFCSEYVISYNEQKAAQIAGFSPFNAKAIGQRLLTHPIVRKEIQRLQKNITKKLQITQERVLAEWASIAYANIQDYYDDEGKLKPIKDLDRHLAAAIEEVGQDRKGRLKYKLIRKTIGLDALSKSIGIFDKDIERTLPFNFKEFLKMLPPEKQEEIKIAAMKRIGGNSK